jgi:hypothetical protein
MKGLAHFLLPKAWLFAQIKGCQICSSLPQTESSWVERCMIGILICISGRFWLTICKPHQVAWWVSNCRSNSIAKFGNQHYCASVIHFDVGR